jgi:hypothetical protein
VFVMLVVVLRRGRCVGRGGGLLLCGRSDGCRCLRECAERKQSCEGGDGDLFVHCLYFLKKAMIEWATW